MAAALSMLVVRSVSVTQPHILDDAIVTGGAPLLDGIGRSASVGEGDPARAVAVARHRHPLGLRPRHTARRTSGGAHAAEHP